MSNFITELLINKGLTPSNRPKKQITERPNCSVPGCNYKAAYVVAKSHPKYPQYRRSKWIKKLYPEVGDIWCCSVCHAKNTAKKHGVKTARDLTAFRAGFDSYSEYRNSTHPYLWARLDYCENIDGRLGFTCNTVLPTQEMLNAAGLENWKPKQFLEVDHIDGNHTNNNPQNLQTLCKHCHTIKSYKSGDHLTPGRKTRSRV